MNCLKDPPWGGARLSYRRAWRPTLWPGRPRFRHALRHDCEISQPWPHSRTPHHAQGLVGCLATTWPCAIFRKADRVPPRTKLRAVKPCRGSTETLRREGSVGRVMCWSLREAHYWSGLTRRLPHLDPLVCSLVRARWRLATTQPRPGCAMSGRSRRARPSSSSKGVFMSS